MYFLIRGEIWSSFTFQCWEALNLILAEFMVILWLQTHGDSGIDYLTPFLFLEGGIISLAKPNFESEHSWLGKRATLMEEWISFVEVYIIRLLEMTSCKNWNITSVILPLGHPCHLWLPCTLLSQSHGFPKHHNVNIQCNFCGLRISWLYGAMICTIHIR